jgi:predicted TIM-barrel fold metal-dependent hydrolase
MVIDGHCHAGRGDALTAPWNTDAPLGAYLRRAEAAGIDRTVVFAAFHTDYRVANAEVASLVAANPRLTGFACVNARADAGRVAELVGRAVRDWGFRGIKVHRHQAPLTREVCDAARRWRVPVLYDVAGHAHTLEMIAPQYPDVSFIVPHLGSFADDWRAHGTVIDVLTRHPNVYADTSGVRRFGYLVQAVRRAGPAKLIFGSDGPWLHPGLELHKIRLLGLSPDDEAAVLGGNLLRLLEKGRDRGPRLSSPSWRDPRPVRVLAGRVR